MIEQLLSAIAGLAMEKHLPSGSGIDCDWEFNLSIANLKTAKISFMNSIHCIDDNGIYDGYQDFKVIVPLQEITDFKIQFTGQRREKYIELWRDPLEEMIHNSMESLQEDIQYLIDNLIDLFK